MWHEEGSGLWKTVSVSAVVVCVCNVGRLGFSLPSYIMDMLMYNFETELLKTTCKNGGQMISIIAAAHVAKQFSPGIEGAGGENGLG